MSNLVTKTARASVPAKAAKVGSRVADLGSEQAALRKVSSKPMSKAGAANHNGKPAVARSKTRLALDDVFHNLQGRKNRDFRALYLASPEERIALVRARVGAIETQALAADLGMAQDRFFRMFGIAQATVTRRAARQQPMSTEESEKIIGLAKMVGQVQIMLDQSGDPELIKDFDAPKWLTNWIEQPLPALAGKRPADYLDTMEGQEMVSRLLAMMQTGAYA